MGNNKENDKFDLGVKGLQLHFVVSALDSRLGGLCSRPGHVNCVVLCSLAKHYTLTVPLSIQEYKWVLENCQGSLIKHRRVTL